jgi:replicative DNA helicase
MLWISHPQPNPLRTGVFTFSTGCPQGGVSYPLFSKSYPTTIPTAIPRFALSVSTGRLQPDQIQHGGPLAAIHLLQFSPSSSHLTSSSRKKSVTHLTMVQLLEDARRRQQATSPPASPGRLLPHNLEAEESLLGAMLLSRDAVAVGLEKGSAEYFYKPAHGHVFAAVSALSARGQAIDAVTVAEELRRADLLDSIGGSATLIDLQAGTPSTSNAGMYANIVYEHHMLRRLIGVAGEIADLGYSLPDDVTRAMDRAEQLVFDVAQGRSTDTLVPLHDLLGASLDRLEELYNRGDSITGVPTGFFDLDDQLNGLQKGALYIVGARPAMGKSAFALNIAAHVGIKVGKPAMIFSLEMSHLELTQRLLCADAKVDSKRMRNGRLDSADWPKITAAISRMASTTTQV